MARQLKVLMVAHGHPDYNPGGGEIAAYQLHKALNSQSSTQSAITSSDNADTNPAGHDGVDITSVFFARHDQSDLIHGGTPFAGTGRPGEVLFYSVMPDWFRFSQPDKARVWRDFRSFLALHKPDVVHFHHYFQLGLELIREVKQFSPATQVVMTLHEYMAICNNEGQMLKKQTNELCYESSPSACASCFKERTAQDFFLRKQFIESCFTLVDRFVSPSQFLKNRYVQWGLDEHRIEVIENLLDAEASDTNVYAETENGVASNDTAESSANLSAATSPDTPLRLAYFGQINRFKGLDILLEAMGHLPGKILKQVHLTINGTGLERQPEPFRTRIEKALVSLGDCVSVAGRYQGSELPQLLGATDWMIVPSIWWENSPVVILEAKKFGVPVICSNIGGMQEKVEHGVNGRHFVARRASSLAEQIIWAVQNRQEHQRYASNMAASYPGAEPYQRHRGLYIDLCTAARVDEVNTDFSDEERSVIPLREAG